MLSRLYYLYLNNHILFPISELLFFIKNIQNIFFIIYPIFKAFFFLICIGPSNSLKWMVSYVGQ